ncbi:cytosolic Fe-S cluster assembly factor NUBP2 homolog [Stegodyphus dumicola]|uniref:cytosolic Fe-S cluster assembly factor NUBP2 homolog n=1 Tax=Stegodyphus dumicola TaxID=202533 RepID=UPI0015ABD35E|nr:cytosolic Fe-S cluster assembly factor NUBP2 homolog [Stegodyphus dumicola]
MIFVLAMIKQFLNDVKWQSIDYLVIDMPPGTSDEHITLSENIKNIPNVGAVIVTTPQMVAISDVLREITFCKKASLPVIGIIENMSGFVCPNCKECSAIFSQGGGEALANEANLTFLGSIPLDPEFASCIGKRCAKEDIGEIETLKKFESIAETVVNKMKVS